MTDHTNTSCPNGMPKLVTAKEIQAALNISSSTLWRWTRSGEFPAGIPIGANTVKWYASDVTDWLAQKAAAVRGGKQNNTG